MEYHRKGTCRRAAYRIVCGRLQRPRKTSKSLQMPDSKTIPKLPTPVRPSAEPSYPPPNSIIENKDDEPN